MTLPIASAALLLMLNGPAPSHGYTHDYARIRAGLDRTPAESVFVVQNVPRSAARPAKQAVLVRGRDSVWNGVLIGAGIGAVGGFIWARNICGGNDSECFAIAAPVGLFGGAGIGAAVGAVVDLLANKR